MSTQTESKMGMDRINLVIAVVVFFVAAVAGSSFVLWKAIFPTSTQVTVCEKIISKSTTVKSIKLLNGDTMKVGKDVYADLDPLTTYIVEDRWFDKPVFKGKAEGSQQEGYRCWNAPR